VRAAHARWVGDFGAGGGGHVAMAGVGRELTALRADGREVPVEASISALVEPQGSGREALYTVALRDISRRRQAEAELHRISERYRAIVEQSPDAIWLAEGGLLRLVNPACVALLGAGSAGELFGRPLAEFLDPAALDATAADGKPWQRELRLRRLDGREREIEISLATVPDHGGTALQGVMRDISARKQAETELRQTQASLMAAQRLARLGYFSYDLATRTWSGSPSLLDLVGQPAGTTVPSWDMRLIHPDDREPVWRHLNEEVFARRVPFNQEFRILRGDTGEVRWLHALGHCQSDAQGRLTHLFGSVQDVTERKLATEALERQGEELRRLSARLTEAREEERRHVARELHDELGQRLSALKLDLATLLPHVDAGAAAVRERLRALMAEVDGAIAATRRIATDLRPAMLDDLGLTAAVEWLAADWARRATLKVEHRLEAVDAWLAKEAATTIYRIVQEGLTNVSRHADATQVLIELQREGHDLVLRIADDGHGLAPGDTDKRSSSGLAGIRERARILGGSASLRNRPGGGCLLEVTLPLDRADSRPAELHGVS
jgi:two-component system sensor histidine kinase UhpB